MNPQQIIKKISNKTKAIIITHIYGFPVDMEKILKISKNKNIKIIEDSAEMIGQEYKNKKCGSFGDISTFSFYANKHITMGEGGMIVTNNKYIYEKCKSLRNLCFGFENNRYDHDDIGWNYRITNIQAAIGCGQLKNISWIVKRKREIGKRRKIEENTRKWSRRGAKESKGEAKGATREPQASHSRNYAVTQYAVDCAPIRRPRGSPDRISLLGVLRSC